MDKEVVCDASLDVEMEGRSQVESIRDDSQSIFVGDKKIGKITSYKFKILIRDKATLQGELTRDEMDLMYQLYASEGGQLTQRTVSRKFPKYTFQDFKRILRAFNITKASSPFAPHVIEEKEIGELVDLTLQTKENTYLHKLEQDRNRLTEVKLKEFIKKNFDLQEEIANGSYLISDIDFTPCPFKSANTGKGVDVVVYLSDMHIGAHNSNEGVYDNPYDEHEVVRRLERVYNQIHRIDHIDKLIVLNLGDALDGYNAQTTRSASTHILPQNMTNKEQAATYIKVMVNFFTNIVTNIRCNELGFYSVSESNHGGDYECGIVTGLTYLLEQMDITCHMAPKPIDHFVLGERTFIYLHGKDNQNQFKNFPLTLDLKTEKYMDDYIRHHKITGKITVVKGDLHQSAVTKGKQFTYHSVASLFGSSNWIHANFGLTPWGCDYAIIDAEGNIINGLVEEQL